jgi:hypothetical protein
LKGRLRPADVDPRRVARLVGELNSDRFALRRQASAELEQLGEAAAAALRRAVEEPASIEVRKRAQQILEKIADVGKSPERVRRLRAVEVLERAGTPEARALLQTLAGGTPAARLTREAKASRDRLSRRKAADP